MRRRLRCAALLLLVHPGYNSSSSSGSGFASLETGRRQWSLASAVSAWHGLLLLAPDPSWAKELSSATAAAPGRSVINSYTENAGLEGQNNKDIAKYAQLGDGLRAVTIYSPKFSDGDPYATQPVKNGDVVTVDLIGYLTGWNGNVFVRTQDKSGFSEKPLVFKVGAGDAIPGLDRGVVGMLKGEKRRLIIPPKLGYPRPCKEEQLGKPGAIPNPMDSAPGSGEPWELRNRLLNGVLNNARDDTLVIDVKIDRISK
eukprot:TRINITY_DN34886_c0_g1_i1.p1 TRINITY_DN34886_c0_g1~~TRINITY_DN34886_c0_g1_i1.p1  ORF type:complete len:286 (+),score=60.72 TRINITY_DN34886_c0_g1_i1:92-859(+)